MLRTWKTWLMMGLLVVSTGCHKHRVRPAPVVAAPCPPGGPIPVPSAPGGFAAPRGGFGAPPGSIAAPPGGFPVSPGGVPAPPGNGGFTLPPGAVTTPPPGATVIPPADPLPGGANLGPAAPPGPAARTVPPGPAQVDYRWTPTPGTQTPMRTLEPKTLAPEPGGQEPKGPSRVLLFPPEISEEPPLDPRPVRKKAAGSLPVGIAGFAAARDNVATGLRPSLDEGLDWLAAHDYKTVLHLHQPFDIAAADRKQVEKRGMRYISLSIDPRNLSKETTDEFLRIVSDTTSHPLFVYDRDGSLAGPMWYLYFRVVEELPEDAARVRAGGLGLRETGEAWEAVRRMVP